MPSDSNSSHRLVRAEPVNDDWHNIRTDLLSSYIAEHLFKRIRRVTAVQFSGTLTKYLADPEAYDKTVGLFEHAAYFKGLTLARTPLAANRQLFFLSIFLVLWTVRKPIIILWPFVLCRDHQKSIQTSLDTNREDGAFHRCVVHFLWIHYTPYDSC